jgi:large subunit ribosomal protein L29
MAAGTKVADVRAKSEDELKAMLLDLRKEQFNLRFQRASGQLEATGRIKTVRRDIARLKTITGERQRAAAPANQPKA